jgi:hypothetical protein
MSLASISSSTSSGISQVPSHQVIGKSGSFWLPEKIEESFASKVRESSQGKDGKKSLNLKGEQSGKSKTSGKSSSTAASLGRNTAGAEKSVARRSQPASQSLHSGKTQLTEVKLPRGQMAKPVTVLSQRSDQVQRHGTGKIPVTQQGKALKNSARNSSVVTENLKDSIIDPDGRRGDENNHGKRRGAKNASNLAKMEVSHSQQDIQVMEGRESRESVPSASPQARGFLNLLAKSVLPRISYLDKHAKKVVRFAVDLPNKAKLGVRLEKSEGSISICFICSDPETLAMLGFTKDALSESLSDQSGKRTQINVFNNYKEMDDHFSRAA